MKTLRPWCVLVFALACSASAVAADEEGFVSIFNGKDLSGWEGDPVLWSVEEGAITGKTTDEAPLDYNKFILWRGGKVENFELRAMVRLVGNSNSGIQYRSRELPEVGPWSVGGYQADIHPTPANNAMLYDERGRGIIAQQTQKVIIDPEGNKWITGSTGPVQEVKLDQWNEYSIIATGNHLIQKLNGKTTVDVIDLQESERELEGIIAIQVHRGPAMKVQIKDIHLKVLPEGGVLSPDEAPIPAGAQKVAAPGKKPAVKKAGGAKGKGRRKAR